MKNQLKKKEAEKVGEESSKRKINGGKNKTAQRDNSK